MTDMTCDFAEALETFHAVSHYAPNDPLLIESLDTALSDCIAHCSETQIAAVYQEVAGETIIASKARWVLPAKAYEQPEKASSMLVQVLVGLGKQIGLTTFSTLLSATPAECVELNEANGKAFKRDNKGKTADDLAEMLTTMNNLFTERQHMTFLLASLRVIYRRMTKFEAYCYDYQDVEFSFDDVVAVCKGTCEDAGNNKALLKSAAVAYSILTDAQLERFSNAEALKQSLHSTAA